MALRIYVRPRLPCDVIARERVSANQWLPPWLRHQHITRYRWAAQFCTAARVLDAACANGYGSALLLEAGARFVAGADIAPEAIAEAARLHRNLPLLVADGIRLPFHSAAFDVFVSFETVEHVRDDHAFVAEARRVVRQGGAFICSTPNRNLVNAGKSISDRPFNPFHVREYTRDELRRLLASQFATIEWFGQREYERTYVSALAMAGRVMQSAAVRLHQLRKLAGVPLESAQKHMPVPLVAGSETEVLIAVCR